MNWAHIHLLLNHIPIIGTAFGVVSLSIALMWRSKELKKISLGIFVVAALKNLADAAKAEKQMEYVHFAEKLMVHAQTEEKVLYPATIMIGEYLKLKLRK